MRYLGESTLNQIHYLDESALNHMHHLDECSKNNTDDDDMVLSWNIGLHIFIVEKHGLLNSSMANREVNSFDTLEARSSAQLKRTKDKNLSLFAGCEQHCKCTPDWFSTGQN